MNIEDLRKSISEMSDDELLEIIGTTRNNRRKPKKKKRRSKASRTRAKSKKKKKKTSLDDLTPEQARKLLEQIQNKE